MSGKPRDDERDDAPAGDSSEEQGPPIPPPSTWAGRSRSPASDDGPKGDSGDSPGSPDETDDFDRIEREASEDLDNLEELDTAERQQSARTDHAVPAGLGDSVEAPADDDDAEVAEPDPADELVDPPDEFAFEEQGDEVDVDEDEPSVDAQGAGEPADPSDSEEPDLADVSPVVAAAAAAGETIEADTLSLADREAAKEAAMEGVRARTRQHEVEPSQRTAKHQPVAAGPVPATAAGRAAAAQAPKKPVAAQSPGGVGGAGEPPKRRGFGWRFVAAASLIVMSIATATAVYSLLFLSDFAEGIGHNEKFATIKKQLAGVDGGPETIMFLGSDTRAKSQAEIKNGGDPGRSDTTLLARIDPDNNTINLLSLPRDLKVDIPGVGTDKLNAAYTYGGQDLTLKTVKNLMDIDVNHIVNINFDGFYDAVNAVDCVYIDVDHHYFHSNAGLDPSEYYDEIDVPAGYQRLCGYNALNYVRYRHDDNDLVRGARQQDFIRELRQRIPPEKVFDPDLRKIFIKYTTSDISDPTSLLEVLKTLFGARGAQVRQIPFEASSLGDATSSYVTATPKEIEDVRNQFLGVTPPPTPAPATSSDSGSSGGDNSKKKPKPAQPPDSGTVDISGGAQDKAKGFLKKAPGLPVFYPTQGLADSTLSDNSRAYAYLGPEEKDKYRGYKYVFEFPSNGLDSSGSYDAYYGVEGTNWTDPPILDDPTKTQTIDGRDYELFYDGGKLRLVGFKTSQGSYWVNNSLTNLLTEPQMLSIAESLREYKP